MSNSYGPNIVTNGLILHLDVANQRSYNTTGNTLYDLSGSGNNGSLINGPTYSQGNSGNLTFNGSNQYINISNIALPTGSNPHTVSSWIYKLGDNTSNGWVSLFGYGVNANNQKRMLFVSSNFGLNNKVYTGFYSNDYNWGTGITNNVWTHLAWVFDGSIEYLYINGALYNTHTPSGGINTTLDSTNHCIAGYFDTGFISYYNGKISNFSLYNRSLSATEVLQNYNAHKSRFGLT